MRRFTTSLLLGWTLALLPQVGCRSNGDKDIQDPQSLPPSQLTELDDAPVLQKVVGGLTRDYPENRYEICTLIKTDFPDPARVKAEIARVNGQPLSDGFILTGVIPSIQYFGYIEGQQVLLSEISDTKRRIRIPAGDQGNPSLDYLMEFLNTKCGVKDARP